MLLGPHATELVARSWSLLPRRVLRDHRNHLSVLFKMGTASHMCEELNFKLYLNLMET